MVARRSETLHLFPFPLRKQGPMAAGPKFPLRSQPPWMPACASGTAASVGTTHEYTRRLRSALANCANPARPAPASTHTFQNSNHNTNPRHRTPPRAPAFRAASNRKRPEIKHTALSPVHAPQARNPLPAWRVCALARVKLRAALRAPGRTCCISPRSHRNTSVTLLG